MASGQMVPPTSHPFPSLEGHRALRQRFLDVGLDGLNEAEERWFWHAYDYGFRQAYLGDQTRKSPIDRDGKWYAWHLAEPAEDFWRERFGLRKREEFPSATSQDAVRRDWRRIPSAELTAAERELAAPEFERMATAARKAIEAAESKWSRGFQPPRQRKPAPEIPPHVLPDDNDPAVQEWLSSMGSLTQAAE